MIKLEKTEVIGWGHAIRGMRNPMNSWEKSDSFLCKKCINQSIDSDECYIDVRGRDIDKYYSDGCYIVGENDLKLMKSLAKSGTDHRKFMRMIAVYVDITAPLYWWKEMDTYKVGTVANSCSTMHKIHAYNFDRSDFSCEKLLPPSLQALDNTITELNFWRNIFINGGHVHVRNDMVIDFDARDKRVWDQMIQLLPSSYNQKRTVMLNYEVLANIYKSRKNHKLDEWHVFCEWIESLPYATELICARKEDENGTQV